MLRMIRSVDAPPIPGLPDNTGPLPKPPAGTPLLFKPDGTFASETHLFLLDRVIRKVAKRPRLKTLHAYAEDLSVWWAFLGSNDLDWTPMSEESIRDYAYVLQQTISPKTGEPYKTATIARRVGTVIEFYRWATAQGLATCELSTLAGATFKFRSSDDLHLAHTSSGKRTLMKTLHIRKEDPADKVNILTPAQTKRVLERLGPDIRNLKGIGKKPIRDRLVSEWSLLTGMRLMEVTSLEVADIDGLTKGESFTSPAELFKLRITKTKGNHARTILAPAYLLKATGHYIKTERHRAINAAKKSNSTFQEPAEVFVNGLDANSAYIGRRLSEKIASKHFRTAVIDCEFVFKYKTTRGIKTGAMFHFHDLRHTFAVRMYTLLELLGRREPWKSIQALLGHKNLSTTMKIYLKHVRVDEALIGDAVNLHLNQLADEFNEL